MTRLRWQLSKLLRRTASYVDPPSDVPDQLTLERTVTHIAYEVVALEVAAQFYCDPKSAHRPLLLEAFLIHVRNLRDFFWGTPKARFAHNDIFAQYYCHKWLDYRGPVPAALDRTWNAIDWQLVHITRARTNATRAETLDEDVLRLSTELRQGWEHFLKRLDPEWRGRFQRRYDERKALPW